MPWWPTTAPTNTLDGASKSSKPAQGPHISAKPKQQHFEDPRNVVTVLLLTTACIGTYSFYRSYLQRIPQAYRIGDSFWRKRSVLGKVTRVGDGDNFHLFHTPGGRLTGWGWLPWRRVPNNAKNLKDKTIHIRLAGVDAPETAHFGRPGQPFGKEALEWLNDYLLNRRVRAYVYKKDQYDRAVATVYIRKGLLRRDVGLQMLRSGFATVYEAKSGAEFGNLEEKYRKAEWWAKARRRGMWQGRKQDYESPMEFKRRTAMQEKDR